MSFPIRWGLPLLFLHVAFFCAVWAVNPDCRALPGDAAWPSATAWASLNKTVGGRLIATVPLGAPCHDPTYNATECSALAQGWPYVQTHLNSSSSIVAPLFQNHSCDPYSPESSPCLIGNYVDYAINISGASDVAAGLHFARENNVRVVIKNTGHDLLGKSTGRGGLGLWTHYLKEVNLFNYSGPNYMGPAAKIGAGSQVWEVSEAANVGGFRVVAGSCPTIAVAGGFTQGGGYGILSSIYGLSADNVLEWEVVTASGNHLVATPTNNSDLYWALSGGGASSYAVILSMTVKAYPDGPVSAAEISFSISNNVTANVFWKGVEAFHTHMPFWSDKGASTAYILSKDAFTVLPLSFPDKTSAYANQSIVPFLADLASLEIPYTLNITTFSNYLSEFATYFGPLPYGLYPSAQVQGSRLIPRKTLTTNNAALTAILRNITSSGIFTVLGTGLNVSRVSQSSANAVLPAWRDAALEAIVASPWNFSLPWSEMVGRENTITQQIIPSLEAITPGSGAYLNEGDPHQPRWQEAFYGANYEKLVGIKKKWDPEALFYATTAVGANSWYVAADGRLCRTGE